MCIQQSMKNILLTKFMKPFCYANNQYDISGPVFLIESLFINILFCFIYYHLNLVILHPHMTIHSTSKK